MSSRFRFYMSFLGKRVYECFFAVKVYWCLKFTLSYIVKALLDAILKKKCYATKKNIIINYLKIEN